MSVQTRKERLRKGDRSALVFYRGSSRTSPGRRLEAGSGFSYAVDSVSIAQAGTPRHSPPLEMIHAVKTRPCGKVKRERRRRPWQGEAEDGPSSREPDRRWTRQGGSDAARRLGGQSGPAGRREIRDRAFNRCSAPAGRGRRAAHRTGGQDRRQNRRTDGARDDPHGAGTAGKTDMKRGAIHGRRTGARPRFGQGSFFLSPYKIYLTKKINPS